MTTTTGVYDQDETTHSPIMKLMAQDSVDDGRNNSQWVIEYRDNVIYPNEDVIIIGELMIQDIISCPVDAHSHQYVVLNDCNGHKVNRRAFTSISAAAASVCSKRHSTDVISSAQLTIYPFLQHMLSPAAG